MEEALDDWLYSTGGESADSLEQIVLYYLGLRVSTLAVAESCTGGMIAARITSVPGASRSFVGGAIVYSDDLKRVFANVQPGLIEKYGAVSQQVAEALAEGIRIRTGADLGLGVTGIAGPTGATETKPAGLVYIALSDGNKMECIEKNFRGDRARVRDFATQQALDLIRKRLM
jgi:nicotinamide-nucleotide amidase